jgi:hypothetical protein
LTIAPRWMGVVRIGGPRSPAALTLVAPRR